MRTRNTDDDNFDFDWNGGVVPPGGKVRCPVMLMDSMVFDAAMHRPGFRDRNRDERREAYADYCVRLGDAWKQPGKKPEDEPDDEGGGWTSYQPNVTPPEHDPTVSENARAPTEKARAEYLAKLQSNWKNPERQGMRYEASPDDVALAERVSTILQLGPPVTSTSAPPFQSPKFGALPTGNLINKLMQRDDIAAAQARKDAAYAERVRHLENDWRTPPPSRATEIERQAESENWRHGA